jgi:Ni/Fe-hydrogenase subunit HybB-like protein
VPLFKNISRWLSLYAVFLPLLMLVTELAEANKFETISRGVASGDKLGQLKFIGLIAGGFFSLSAIGLFLARKKLAVSPVAPIVMFLFGGILASFWLIDRL